MPDHYCPTIFLAYVIGNTLYCLLVLFSFLGVLFASSAPSNALVFSSIAAVCRASALVLHWLVWTTKPADEAHSSQWGTNQLSSILLWIQAGFPVLISLTAVFRLWALLLNEDCTHVYWDPVHSMCDPNIEHGGLSLTILMEVVFNPMLTFLLLRDTPVAAISLSWAINLVVLVTYSVTVRSPEVICATAGYAYASLLIYCDVRHRSKKTAELVNRLQTAVAENEELAVEAQAIELRAMIGNVAHDLKSPLTSFLSGVECMLEVVLSWEALLVSDQRPQFLSKAPNNLATIKACLHSMDGTNRFMTMTINRCLDYTKASKGFKLVPKQETVALMSVLDLPIRMMRDVQHKIRIQVTPWNADICSHVITDQQWLLENLLCLLSNAVKYSHTGQVDVSVTLIANPFPLAPPDAHDNDYTEHHLRFDVLDMGIGLSDEAMAKLFAPFKQAQRLAGGTGLGLFSLARRVEALSGQYGVSKRPDGAPGSLFWFTIPYRPDAMSASVAKAGGGNGYTCAASPVYSENSTRAVAPEVVDSPDTMSSLESSAVAQKGFTILVVDDAPLIVRMTTMLLKRKGHTVVQAVNGAEALDKILGAYTDDWRKSYKEAGTPAFDVVVMDLQMPIMDGIEAIRRVRTAEAELVSKELSTRRCNGPSRGIALSAASAQEALCWDVEQGKCAGSPARDESKWSEPDLVAPPKWPKTGAGGPLLETDCAYRSGRATVFGSNGALSDSSRESHDSKDSKDSPVESKASDEQSAPSRSSLRQRYHQFIIAVSANSDHETVQEALSAGADSFISKPFAYDSFLQAIEHRMK